MDMRHFEKAYLGCTASTYNEVVDAYEEEYRDRVWWQEKCREAEQMAFSREKTYVEEVRRRDQQLQSTKDDLRSKTKQIERMRCEHQDEINRKEKDYTQAIRRAREEVRTTAQREAEKIEQLRAAMATHKTEVEELQADNKKIISAANSAEDKHKTEMAKLHEDYDKELRTARSEQDIAMAAHTSEMANLCAEHAKQINDIQSQVRELEKNEEVLKDLLHKEKHKVADHAAQSTTSLNHASDAKIDKLRAELKAKDSRDIAKLEGLVHALQEEVHALQTEQANWKVEAGQLSARLAKAIATENSLRKELAESRIGGHADASAVSHAKLRELEEEVDRHLNALEKAQTELWAAKSEIDYLQKVANCEPIIVRELEKNGNVQNYDLADELADARREKHRLQIRADDLTTQNAMLRAETDRLRRVADATIAEWQDAGAATHSQLPQPAPEPSQSKVGQMSMTESAQRAPSAAAARMRQTAAPVVQHTHDETWTLSNIPPEMVNAMQDPLSIPVPSRRQRIKGSVAPYPFDQSTLDKLDESLRRAVIEAQAHQCNSQQHNAYGLEHALQSVQAPGVSRATLDALLRNRNFGTLSAVKAAHGAKAQHLARDATELRKEMTEILARAHRRMVDGDTTGINDTIVEIRGLQGELNDVEKLRRELVEQRTDQDIAASVFVSAKHEQFKVSLQNGLLTKFNQVTMIAAGTVLRLQTATEKWWTATCVLCKCVGGGLPMLGPILDALGAAGKRGLKRRKDREIRKTAAGVAQLYQQWQRPDGSNKACAELCDYASTAIAFQLRRHVEIVPHPTLKSFAELVANAVIRAVTQLYEGGGAWAPDNPTDAAELLASQFPCRNLRPPSKAYRTELPLDPKRTGPAASLPDTVDGWLFVCWDPSATTAVDLRLRRDARLLNMGRRLLEKHADTAEEVAGEVEEAEEMQDVVAESTADDEE